MNYQVDVMTRPADDVLGVTISTPANRVGTAVGSAIARLLAQTAQVGLQPGGPPETTYLSQFTPGTAALAQIRVDLPVTGRVDKVADVRHRASCELARTLHRGPYDQVGDAMLAITKWATANNRRVTGPPTEVYLVGPTDDRDPSDYLTEIHMPVSA